MAKQPIMLRQPAKRGRSRSPEGGQRLVRRKTGYEDVQTKEMRKEMAAMNIGEEAPVRKETLDLD